MATEEIIISQLLREGQTLIDDKNWKEAIQLLGEAEGLTRWIEIYGSQIYSSLALAYSYLGNLSQTKHYLSMYNKFIKKNGN